MQGPALGYEARPGLSLLWSGRLSKTGKRELMDVLILRGAAPIPPIRSICAPVERRTVVAVA
jgi:hypothetical protein